MQVEIKKPERLYQLERQTGIPADALVNEILDIHLDEEKKGIFLLRELDKVFEQYKQIHGLKA